MAQINLPHTLVAGTPENINDVQDMFQEVVDFLNNALVGDDNLTSPNNGVPRVVFSVGGAHIVGSTTAGTYTLGNSLVAQSAGSNGAYVFPIWIPNTADFAVAGKTTQVRLVAYAVVNSTAPGITLTVGLQGITAVSGASSAVMTFTLAGAQNTPCAFTTPAAGSMTRVASNWGSLAGLTANAYCFTVIPSGTMAANSLVSFSAAVEMRHT